MEHNGLGELPLAPAWAQTVGEAGRLSVLVALGFFAIALLAYAGAGRFPKVSKLGDAGLLFGSLGLASAFGCLITLFVRDQFQFEYVFARADIHTALQYKVAGVWSGQQGSFMLWGVASAIFVLLALPGTGPYRRGYGSAAALFLGSIAGILAYETPFNLIKEVVDNGHVHQPMTGNGMTPSLQNYWIVIHPPTIFLGFGALTVLFAYAVSSMLTGDVRGWAMRARPWALVATAILSLGICMGGFWAYETLGWGGFWMWDPVENASFVPWLMVAALLHGLIVQITRSRWHGANLWLGALPFFAFLYGTFLTRSGALGDTSVHSFANMDQSALKVLIGFTVAAIAGFAVLYGVRGHRLAKEANVAAETTSPANRESAYLLGVILLSAFGLVLAVGMSWPLITSLLGRPLAKVEEPLYHKVVVWFFVPIMLLMGAAPFLSWRGLGWKILLGRLSNVLSLAIGTVGLILFSLRGPEWGLSGLGQETVSMPFGFRMAVVPWVAFLLLLCAFAAFGNLWRLGESLRRSRSSAGAFVSHFGLAVLLAGLIVSRGFEREDRGFMRPSQPLSVLGYNVKYREMVGKNLYDRDGKLVLDVTGPDGSQFTATPGFFYNRNLNSGQDEAFVWPHVEREAAHDVYLALGQPIMYAWDGDGLWLKPGETQLRNGIRVTYEKMISEGTPGTESAKFGAQLYVQVMNEDGSVAESHRVTPKLAVQGMTPEMPFVGRDLRAVLYRMDAKDQSAQIQMLFAEPLFPVQVYTKPLTAMVWAGTGILFLGGLMAAVARRRPRPADVEETEDDLSSETPRPQRKPNDAPLPAT